MRDRRQGAQSFYALATDTLPDTAKVVLQDAARSGDPTLAGDQKRLSELDAERRGGLPDSVADEVERYYSPGRTWQSLALGIAALLKLGDMAVAGFDDFEWAELMASPLTCIDQNSRMIAAAKERLAKVPHARALVGDVHDLPFPAASFDSVLIFHTLTYAEHPARALAECSRVLRPGGRVVLLCLDQHQQHEVTARYGERHPGFSPRAIRGLLGRAGLQVVRASVACREARKPHLQVVLAIADKAPAPSTQKQYKKQ